MGKNKQIPIVGPFYEDKSKNLNAQRCVNLFPVVTIDGGKRPNALYSTPGTEVMYSPSVGGAVVDVVSDFINDENETYVVYAVGNGSVTEYKIAGVSTGAVVADFGAIQPRTSSATAKQTVGLAQNDDYIFMAVPTFNPAVDTTVSDVIFRLEKSNISNLVAGSSNAVITLGTTSTVRPSDVAYMDGYVIINHVPTVAHDSMRGAFFANFANIDLACTSLFHDVDFAKMYYMNDTVIRVYPAGGYLYVFGLKHYEIWYNSGNETFPFEPIKEATKEVGLVHSRAICKYADSIALIGEVGGGKGVYLLNGTQIKKISTPAIDTYLDKYATTVSKSKNNNAVIGFKYYGAYTYQEDGHIFFCFSITDDNDIGTTLIYDQTTDAWHERNTADPIRPGNSYSPIRSGIGVDGRVLLGVKGTSSIYTFDSNKCTDDVIEANTAIERYRITQHISGEDHHVFHNRFRLDIEPTQASNVDANITLSFSDDDGKTWKTVGTKSFSNASYGNISGDKRLEWFRLGRSDDRIYKIWTNANTPVYISGGYADVEMGYR